MVINPIVGIYIPIIRIPIKGGMTIPTIATFDHGTSVILQEGGKSISRRVSMGIHHYLMTISTGLVVDLYIDLSLITTHM